MSNEGVTFVMRVVLLVVLVVAAAAFRTMFGPGRKRGRFMLAGTLGGMAFGVLIAPLASRWLDSDTSALCATFGIILGWTVAWTFARHVPREA
jgi:hypothetical protein